jgi:hypothetical protein
VRDVRTRICLPLKVVFAGLALVCCCSGCARWPIYLGPDFRKQVSTPDATEIVYRLDASQLHVPVAVARVEGQLVSYNEVPGSVLPDRTVGTLKIVCPCADAPVGYARAEVQVIADPLPNLKRVEQVSSRSSWLARFGRPTDTTSEAVRETWALDLPKQELDQLLGRLATPGSVTIAKKGEAAGGNISTLFNARRSAGSCHPIPELDALMRRVRNEGQLVAYTNPLSAQVARNSTPASVVAYRDLHRQEEAVGPGLSSGAAPQLAQSGLSMPCSRPSGRILAVRPSDDVPVRR